MPGLRRNHASAPELWVGYYRKSTGKVAMTYPEAVEEALCFGWIDGLTFRIDDEVHANRYTPRRKGSGWSAPNIAKVAELTACRTDAPDGAHGVRGARPRKDAPYMRDHPHAPAAPS